MGEVRIEIELPSVVEKEGQEQIRQNEKKDFSSLLAVLQVCFKGREGNLILELVTDSQLYWDPLYRAPTPHPFPDIRHGTLSLSPGPTPIPIRQTREPHAPPPPLLVASAGHHWRPVQIVHLRTPPPVLTSKARNIRLVSGWCASYWNTFWFYYLYSPYNHYVHIVNTKKKMYFSLVLQMIAFVGGR